MPASSTPAPPATPARRKKRKPTVPLPPAVENALSRQEREALVSENRAFVHMMVRRERARCPALARQEYDDLVQEGMMAAWKAAKLFDPHRGTGFLAYAGRAIVQRLWRVSEIATRKRACPADGSFVHSLDAVMDAPGMNPGSPLYGWLPCALPDPASPDPEKEAVRNEQVGRVRAALAQLARERPLWAEVLRLRAMEGWGLADVAERLGRSKERVRQIQLVAEGRLGRILGRGRGSRP